MWGCCVEDLYGDKAESREVSWETGEIFQMMGNRGLEIWERWSDSEYVLKVALTGYSGGLNMGQEERTQRGLQCFGLGHLEERPYHLLT